MIVYIVEGFTALILVLLFITQVLLPILKHKPLFPILRREWTLRKKLEEKEQARTESELEQQLQAPGEPTNPKPTNKE